MGDVVLMDDWMDVHITHRDLEKTHDLVIIKKVGVNLSIKKTLTFITLGTSKDAVLCGRGLHWQVACGDRRGHSARPL